MEAIMSDAIVLDFQNKYYKGAPANSFDPLANSVKRILEDGVLLHNEVCYSHNYPNSFADIYYTDSGFSVKRPTILYLHGGGWFMGSRTDGDPLASAGGGIARQNIMLAHLGYHVVSMDYCLAPQYRHPNQLLQINECLGFFQEHCEEYHLDMGNVVIMGSSAGAVLTAQMGLVLSHPAYARELGISPAINLSCIRGMIIDGGPMIIAQMNEPTQWMVKTWLGKNDLDCKEGRQMHVAEWVTKAYPECFLTAGNNGCFPDDMQELGQALRAKGVAVSDYYTDPAVSKQPHGYLGNWESDPYAREGMERMLAFLKRVTQR